MVLQYKPSKCSADWKPSLSQAKRSAPKLAAGDGNVQMSQWTNNLCAYIGAVMPFRFILHFERFQLLTLWELFIKKHWPPLFTNWQIVVRQCPWQRGRINRAYYLVIYKRKWAILNSDGDESVSQVHKCWCWWRVGHLNHGLRGLHLCNSVVTIN